MTSVCRKVIESIIRDSIVEHLTKYQLIRSTQHGFVNGRSTQTNLLEYMEKLSKLVDEGHSVDVIYCDLMLYLTGGCLPSVKVLVSEARCSGGWRSG